MHAEDDFSAMSKYTAAKPILMNSIIERVTNKIKENKHLILCGPPGTGKTRIVSRLLSSRDALDIGERKFVQFHPQYSYQDFIEGYSVADGKFHYKSGVFLNFIKKGGLKIEVQHPYLY